MIKRYNKERLFEMMNRVAEMPLIKEQSGSKPKLPSWAISSAKDFIPLEDYEKEVPCATNIQEVERELNPNKIEIEDPIDWLRQKDINISKGKTQDVKTGGRLSTLMLANTRTGDSNVAGTNTQKLSPIEKEKLKLSVDTDYSKVDYDLDELRNILKIAPNEEQLIGKNGKMEKTDFFNITLPAYKGIFCDEDTGKFYIINVCDKADTCSKVCFAQMGNFIKNDPPIRLNAQKLNYLLNHSETWKGRVINRIKSLYNGMNKVVVRWHDSGDFFSEEYMKLAFEIAEKTKKYSEHYAYTKEVGMAKSLRDGGSMPSNFEFKYSFGGKQDDLIDKTKDPHAVIVPKKLFSDLQPDETKTNPKTKQEYIGKGWNFSKQAFAEIKRRLAEEYGIDIRTILTHSELLKKPFPHGKNVKRIWNVIGVSGDSDIAALRRDVLGIYLLVHK